MSRQDDLLASVRGSTSLLGRGAALLLAVLALGLGCNAILGFDEGQPVSDGSGSGGDAAAGGTTPTGTATGSGATGGSGTGGSGTGGSGTGGTGTGGTSAGGGGGINAYQCQNCLANHCDQEMSGCFQSASCAWLWDCWIGCIDGTWDKGCIRTCVEQYGMGKPQLLGLMPCWYESCHDECMGSGCGVWGDWMELTMPACQPCLDANCATECVACEQQPECLKLGLCMFSCPSDPGCTSDCQTDYAGGVQTYEHLYDEANGGCGEDSCTGDCHF